MCGFPRCLWTRNDKEGVAVIKSSGQVETLIKPIVEKLGFNIVRIKYGKEYGELNLTVVIESKKGSPISLDDCEKVSKAIDEPLEQFDPTNGKQYCLNVESKGLEGDKEND